MALRFYISRILHNKIKLFFICLILIMPSLEIIQIVFDVIYFGLPRPNPNYVTFLAGYRGHVFESIMLWFMPLYLLIITAEDSIEDYDIGYRNILISKIGKKNYYLNKLVGSFAVAFVIVLVALLIDIILLHTLFSGGQDMPVDPNDSPENLLYTISNAHPITANIVFAVVTAFLSGLISMVGAALAIVVHNRKIVYSVTFLLWFIPVLLKTSLMLVVQPFSEYDFDDLIPIFLSVSVSYIVIVAVVTVWEVKFEEI